MQRLITTHVNGKLLGKQQFDCCCRWRVSVLHINILFPKHYHHGMRGQIFSVNNCRNPQVQMWKMLRRIWSVFTNFYSLSLQLHIFLSYFTHYYNSDTINVRYLDLLFVIFLVPFVNVKGVVLSRVCLWVAT